MKKLITTILEFFGLALFSAFNRWRELALSKQDDINMILLELSQANAEIARLRGCWKHSEKRVRDAREGTHHNIKVNSEHLAKLRAYIKDLEKEVTRLDAKLSEAERRRRAEVKAKDLLAKGASHVQGMQGEKINELITRNKSLVLHVKAKEKQRSELQALFNELLDVKEDLETRIKPLLQFEQEIKTIKSVEAPANTRVIPIERKWAGIVCENDLPTFKE